MSSCSVNGARPRFARVELHASCLALLSLFACARHAPPPGQDLPRFYILRASTRSSIEMRAIASALRDRLAGAPHVIDATVCGGATSEIDVDVDAARARALAIAPGDVTRAIAGADLGAPAGGGDSLRSLQELAVGQAGDVRVRVADVAMVRYGSRPDACQVLGRPGIVLSVHTHRGSSVDAAIRSNALPADVSIEPFQPLAEVDLPLPPGISTEEAEIVAYRMNTARLPGDQVGLISDGAVHLFLTDPRAKALAERFPPTPGIAGAGSSVADDPPVGYYQDDAGRTPIRVRVR